MQGKGIVKFFLVVMTLVTLLQYLFIIPTQRVEKDAEEYAKELSEQVKGEVEKNAVFKRARATYLDSMSTQEVFKLPLLPSYTYQELKSRQLALGLDLKGGMSVVLQVDLRDFIRSLANDSKDPTFLEALEKAAKAQQSEQTDFVTLFGQQYASIKSETENLAPIFQRNESMRDQVNYNTTDAEIIALLREKATETVDLTFKLLKQRIDKLGVTQPNVSLDRERDLIIVELPGIDNPERARNSLQAAAKLEFWNLYRVNDPGVVQFFVDVNEKLRAEQGLQDQEPEMQIDTITTLDSLGNEIITYDTTEVVVNTAAGPLFDVFQVNSQGSFGLGAMGLAERTKLDTLVKLLNREDIASMFPGEVMFRFDANPIDFGDDVGVDDDEDLYRLYAIKLERDGKAPLTGEHITTAGTSPDPQTGEVAVSLSMDGTGTRIWNRMTTVAANDNNREIAILLDDEVVSAPRVINPIPGGNTSITGGFSIQEANDLANILEIGKLPAETRIIQESLVGPSLGQENIDRSLKALIIGFSMVFIFMLIYYGGGGIVSIITLLLNLFFIFGALASYGTVLTLPGIAGIVLTIGMAVDANVIIYERIREELRDGKSLLMAIGDGFKHSYSAIIDANVTTILTAFVLAYFGLGPIKGFAVVLIIGVLSSLFTAVLVGRLLIDTYTKKDRNMTFSTSFSKNALANLKIDWLSKRKVAYVISGVILLAGIGSFFTRGFELGVDFKGGYSYNVTFDAGEEVNAQQIREALTTSFEGNTPIVKAVDTENTFNVVTDYLIDAVVEEDDAGNIISKPEDIVMEKLYQGINGITTADIDSVQFRLPDGIGTNVTSSSKVGPTIADDIQRSAVYATIFALLLIFLYIFLRFSKWQYSMGAVAALFHDTLIVLSFFSIFHGILPFTMEIDQAFIAAILTVIGYSINDTVVVFDRIREYFNKYTRQSKEEVINGAINSTVSRTVITSLTTLFVVAVLFVFGGASIKGFAFALLIGIIVGTYSSIFIATPVMADLTGDMKAVDKSEKKSFSKAAKK
ncbi:MAG: protein translocase subunit SecDF [Bacteroidetes bacterium]|nr:MAG: protein translocase subunit SecDF [Bacteroidota bacterium]